MVFTPRRRGSPFQRDGRNLAGSKMTENLASKEVDSMTTTAKWTIFVSGVSTGLGLAAFFTSRVGTEIRNQIRNKIQQETQALRDKRDEIENTLERERKA